MIKTNQTEAYEALTTQLAANTASSESVQERIGSLLADLGEEISDRIGTWLATAAFDEAAADTADPDLEADKQIVELLQWYFWELQDEVPYDLSTFETAREGDLTDGEIAALTADVDRAHKFIIGLDPLISPAQSVAYRQLRSYLETRSWVPYKAALAVMRMPPSTVKLSTAKERLSELLKTDLVEVRGTVGRGRNPKDTREVKLVAWPDPDEHLWVETIECLYVGRTATRERIEKARIPSERIDAAIDAGRLVPAGNDTWKRAAK